MKISFALFDNNDESRICPQIIYLIIKISVWCCWPRLSADDRLISPREKRFVWSGLDGPWSSAVASAASVFPVCWTHSTGNPPCSVRSIHVIRVDKWRTLGCCFSRTCYIGVPAPVAGCPHVLLDLFCCIIAQKMEKKGEKRTFQDVKRQIMIREVILAKWSECISLVNPPSPQNTMWFFSQITLSAGYFRGPSSSCLKDEFAQK